MDIKEIDKKYVAPTYARFPLCLVKGSGSLVYDEQGNYAATRAYYLPELQ